MRTQKLSGLVVFLSSVIALSYVPKAQSKDCTHSYYPIIPCSVTAPVCTGGESGCPDRKGSLIYSNSFIKDNTAIPLLNFTVSKVEVKACYSEYYCKWNGSGCLVDIERLIQSYTQNIAPKTPCVFD